MRASAHGYGKEEGPRGWAGPRVGVARKGVACRGPRPAAGAQGELAGLMVGLLASERL